MEESVVVFRATNHQTYSCLIRMDRRLQIVIVSWPDQHVSPSTEVSSLASELVTHYQFNPQRLLLIEHHPDDQRPFLNDPIYSLITFSWNHYQAENPVRQPLSLAEFIQIVLALSNY